jgi:Family of unknown function (DUF5706)
MSDESYILRLLDECREEIRVSDTKASIIFGAVGAFAAILSSQLLDESGALRTNGTAVTVIGVVALASLIVSMLLLGLAVIPRVGRPESGRARYFEEQALFDSATALLQVVNAEAQDAGERHAQQLLVMARIARRKYRHLRSAMLTILVAIGVIIVAVLVGAVN